MRPCLKQTNSQHQNRGGLVEKQGDMVFLKPDDSNKEEKVKLNEGRACCKKNTVKTPGPACLAFAWVCGSQQRSVFLMCKISCCLCHTSPVSQASIFSWSHPLGKKKNTHTKSYWAELAAVWRGNVGAWTKSSPSATVQFCKSCCWSSLLNSETEQMKALGVFTSVGCAPESH